MTAAPRLLVVGESLIGVADRWLRGRTTVVVITRGAAGVTALTASGIKASVPARSVSVIDTVGAGDTLMGALIASLADYEVFEPSLGITPRRRLQSIEPAALNAMLRFCAAAASVTVSRAGANPPWRHELGGGSLIVSRLPDAHVGENP